MNLDWKEITENGEIYEVAEGENFFYELRKEGETDLYTSTIFHKLENENPEGKLTIFSEGLHKTKTPLGPRDIFSTTVGRWIAGIKEHVELEPTKNRLQELENNGRPK